MKERTNIKSNKAVKSYRTETKAPTFKTDISFINYGIKKIWAKTKRILSEISEANEQEINGNEKGRSNKKHHSSQGSIPNKKGARIVSCIRALKETLMLSYSMQSRKELINDYHTAINTLYHKDKKNVKGLMMIDSARGIFINNGHNMRIFIRQCIDNQKSTILKQGLIEDRDHIKDDNEIYMYIKETGQVHKLSLSIYRIELARTIAVLLKQQKKLQNKHYKTKN